VIATRLVALPAALALAAAAGLAAAARAAPAGHAAHAADRAPVKVVYHLTEGIDEAARAMRNVRNHLEADPTAKIVVVANGAGIDFLLDGAQDRNGNPFDATVQDLVTQRVEFRLCRNTLTQRNIDPSKVLPEATIVPSGVAEAARLQAREGFAYIRP
jgi:intracellular sulfur oxidation DsrE/DsrF family protein